MNLTLSLHEFLELITYNQLFDYVPIPDSVGDAIEASILQHHKDMASEGVNVLINSVAPCHIERTDLGYCLVWYPIGCWANELKRRSDLENILAEAKKNPRVVIRPDIRTSKEPEHSPLQKQLIEATMKNDTALIAYLLQQLNEGKL